MTAQPHDTAEAERREMKARAIAKYAWRMGIGSGDDLMALLKTLPWSSRRRSVRTWTSFARAALRHYPLMGWSPPHEQASPTWDLAAVKLDQMAALAAAGDGRVPPVDLADELAGWQDAAQTGAAVALVVAEVVDEIEADVEAYLADQAVPPQPPADAPKGWAALAELGPIPGGEHTCRHCGVAAIVVTLDGGRCAAHPPRRAEFVTEMVETIPVLDDDGQPVLERGKPKTRTRIVGPGRRDGWGVAADWTPKACVYPVRCYCGRPHQGDAEPVPRPGQESAVA